MTSIDKLNIAVDVLCSMNEFSNTELVAELKWKSIPEAYEYQKSVIHSSTRTDIYKLNSTIVINIHNVGLFQIM